MKTHRLHFEIGYKHVAFDGDATAIMSLMDLMTDCLVPEETSEDYANKRDDVKIWHEILPTNDKEDF